MKKNKLLIALVIAGSSSAVLAEDEIKYSVAMKTWNNTFNVANPSNNLNIQSTNSPIVTLTAIKGDYFVSANYMLESSYRYRTVWLSRKDYDYSVGYRYKNNLSFVVGQSVMVFKDGSQPNWVETSTGNFLGVSGFEMLSDKIFVTGNYKHIPSFKVSTTGTDYYRDMKGFSSEVGLGYVLNSTTQLTASYRYQQSKLYNITQSRNETNTMRGLLAGINVNF
jgi:hypothetical protein